MLYCFILTINNTILNKYVVDFTLIVFIPQILQSGLKVKVCQSRGYEGKPGSCLLICLNTDSLDLTKKEGFSFS